MLSGWQYRDGAVEPEALAVDGFRHDQITSGTVVWIDCVDPDDADLRCLAAALPLHDLALEDLAHAGQRTKLERYDRHYHVAVHDLRWNGTELESDEIDVVFADGWVLTVHGRSPSGTDAEDPVAVALRRFERQRSEAGSADEGFILWAILDVVVDRYFLVTDSIDERLDDIEDLVFAETNNGIPRELFAARRALVHFRRAAAPLREVIAELLRREVDCISEAAVTHLQDVYDHELRVLDLAESQRELATGLLEAQLSIQSNQMNQVMKATSSWGAILIVATLIAGIYGMNFKHIPEFGLFWGYPMALGMMALSTTTLYFVFKRRGWL